MDPGDYFVLTILILVLVGSYYLLGWFGPVILTVLYLYRLGQEFL